MNVEWELSQQLTAPDGQGLRAACILPSNNNNDKEQAEQRIVVGTQAGSLWEFDVPSGLVTPISYQHNHAVTALLGGTLNDDAKTTIYVTGCKDHMIRVFDASNHTLLNTLSGHEKPVTSLAWVTNDNGSGSCTSYLISGSWDGTAKVWNLATGAMMATMPNHENSVCVAGLTMPSASKLLWIATGSAGIAQNNQISGHSVRIWTVDMTSYQVTCVTTVANDHEGPIRDLTAFSNNDSVIASCSNDGTVKLRSSQDGTCISTLTFLQSTAHPPMLLSVVSLKENVAAGAEDGHVIVWNTTDGSEPQILLHAQCVWQVLGLDNGDLATCSQDGVLRIFTQSAERYAPAAEREQFAADVQAAQQKKGSGPTPEEIAKLPLWENSAQTMGTSEGQVQVFNKGGVAIAAQWSAVSQTWIEVGQVMGQANDSSSGMIGGVQYDHVLPIEVDKQGGGVERLQIGYNTGENTFTAAQRFIDAHMLPQHHLQEIADYIQQRVGRQAVTLGGDAAAAAAPVAPSAGAGVPMVRYEHLPAPAFQSFDLPAKNGPATLEKMEAKIQEFGVLNPGQLERLSSLLTTLKATNRYHATKVSADEIKLLLEMMESLVSPDQVFPALDLARLAVLHPDAAAASNSAVWSQILTKAASLSEQISDASKAPGVNVVMLALRLMANAFRGGPGSLQAAGSHLEPMISLCENLASSTHKHLRLALATVLLNVSVHLQNTARGDIATRLITIGNGILDCTSGWETEALTRVLVAIGSTALKYTEAKELAKSLAIQTKVEMRASPHTPVTKAVAKEVYSVLS